MSKYFTDDTTSLTNQLEEQLEETNYVIPTPAAVDTTIQEKINQQNIKDIDQKPTSVEEHIAIVNNQNKTVNKMMHEITSGTAEEITNTFETLSTLELFERMNQISFLLVKMNSRLDNIEKVIRNNTSTEQKTNNKVDQHIVPDTTASEKVDYQEVERNKSEISKLSPREQYELGTSKNLSPLEAAQKQLADGIKNNMMPDEGYDGIGTNLEKIFPNMPAEAYQSAYESINDIRNK
jgi:hypothetical protein